MTTTIGILGGGQLGRMLALAGYPLGLRFRVLDPKPDASACYVAEHIVGEYTDPVVLEEFAAGVDVITYEFENVPVPSARKLMDYCPVYPPPQALETAQDRLVEKQFFREQGIPTSSFMPVASRADLDEAMSHCGLPAVLKTRRFGYDGKGQMMLFRQQDCAVAWGRLGPHAPLLLECLVPFDRELSIIAVRHQNGTTACYPLVENIHRNGILYRSQAPAPGVSPAMQGLAEVYAQRVLDALDYVGVLAIELFQVNDTLLANEMAPRVHNSGHWSIEGAVTSQFANHVRAVAGLPLGVTTVPGSATMINIIGTLPNTTAVLEIPGAYLHLYDKEPRPGRKLGHITFHTDTPPADAVLRQIGV